LAGRLCAAGVSRTVGLIDGLMRPMKLIRVQDPRLFYDRVGPYLLQNEAHHNLIISLCNGLINSPDRPIAPILAYVESDDEICAVMVWIAPRSALFSKAKSDEALSLLLLACGSQVPGFAGPIEVGDRIRVLREHDDLWLNLELQIYELIASQRLSLPTIPGKLRLATWRSRQLIVDWLEAFDIEVFGAVQEDPRSIVDGLIERNGVCLWVIDRPRPQAVSLVISRLSIPAAGRIGPVYTPPEFRRRGYGRAAVAAVSGRLLARGCDRCFLFADRQSVITGELYRSIGYRWVGDWVDYRLNGL
jgi:uncharacterized protein